MKNFFLALLIFSCGQLFSQEVIDLPDVIDECTVGVLASDPYYTNYANCQYRRGDSWGITTPETASAEIGQGETFTFIWSKHPNIYARYKIFLISNSRDTITCKDVGTDRFYSVNFCDVSIGTATLAVVAYSTTYVDVQGRKFETDPFLLCTDVASVAVVSPNFPVAVSEPVIETFCSPGTYTLEAPEYSNPVDETVNVVRWYESLDDGISEHFAQGQTIQRYFSQTETVYFSWVREGECNDEAAPLYSSYTMVNNNIQVSAPLPEQKVVCSPGTHNITVSEPPQPGYDILWFEDLNSASFDEGRTISYNFSSVGLTTLYIAYRATNECNSSGITLSQLSPVSVVVTDGLQYTIPPSPKGRSFNGSAGYYTLRNTPSIGDATTVWYNTALGSSPIHVGNDYTTYLEDGLNVHYFSERSKSCANMETDRAPFYSLVVSLPTNPFGILEPTSFTLISSPNPVLNNLSLLVRDNNGVEFNKLNFSFEYKVVSLQNGDSVSNRVTFDKETLRMNVSNLETGVYEVLIYGKSINSFRVSSKFVKL